MSSARATKKPILDNAEKIMYYIREIFLKVFDAYRMDILRKMRILSDTAVGNQSFDERGISMALLHAEHGSHGSVADFLVDTLGKFGAFLDEVVLHSLLDVLNLLPFLFLTYLLMEFIEHKASEKMRALLGRVGGFGPIIGAAVGAVPQCGFSAAAANLYTGRVVTLGTLVAVFLSTSDEMIPILLGGNIQIDKLLLIIVYKIGVAAVAGLAVDLVLRLLGRAKGEINIDEICDEGGCHCEKGILRSALHHTLSVSLWCLAVIAAVGTLVFFIGEEALGAIVPDVPVLSHLICAAVGLIPNCAASVALASLASSGVITVGEMLAGLFAGAGVGIFVLFRMNKHPKENIAVVITVVLIGVIFGAVADLIPAFAI